MLKRESFRYVSFGSRLSRASGSPFSAPNVSSSREKKVAMTVRVITTPPHSPAMELQLLRHRPPSRALSQHNLGGCEDTVLARMQQPSHSGMHGIHGN